MISGDLVNCARLGRVYDVRRMLKGGFDVNVQEGCTALLAAVNHNHILVFDLLMDHGADPNTGDNNGWTPLHLAILNLMGNSDYPFMRYVTELVEAVPRVLTRPGADVNAKTHRDDSQYPYQLLTPLHLACLARSEKLCAYLLECGADPTIVDSENRVPYDPSNCGEDFSEFFEQELLRTASDDKSKVDDGIPINLEEALQEANQQIAALQANLETEKARTKALEQENQEQQLLLEELKESYEQELTKMAEEKQKDSKKFSNFKEAMQERENDFRRVITLLEEDSKKKTEKIYRLQTSVALLSRTAPHFLPLASESSPLHNIAAAQAKCAPCSLHTLTTKGQSSPTPLHQTEGDIAPPVLPPQSPKESLPPEKSPTRRSMAAKEPQTEQIQQQQSQATPTKFRPSTPISSADKERTPQHIRDLDLTPRSKFHALLATPNTVQAAYTMTSLLPQCQPPPSWPTGDEEEEEEKNVNRSPSVRSLKRKTAPDAEDDRQAKRPKPQQTPGRRLSMLKNTSHEGLE